jgi:hypothetical protein
VIASQARQRTSSHAGSPSIGGERAQHLGHVLAELAQPAIATAGTGRRQSASPSQMLRQQPARWLAPLERGHRDLVGCGDLRGLGLRGVLLRDRRAAARADPAMIRVPRTAGLLVPQLPDGELELVRAWASASAARRAVRSAAASPSASSHRRERIIGAHTLIICRACPDRSSCGRFKSRRSARHLRPPCVLRHSPVNPVQQIAKLGRSDSQHAIRRRWPEKAAAIQSFGIKGHSQPIMPKDPDSACRSCHGRHRDRRHADRA